MWSIINITDILMKIKVKESWKTFADSYSYDSFTWCPRASTEKNKEPLLKTTSDSTAIYSLLLRTSFQAWDPGPFRHCRWRMLTCTWSQCWHLLCAFCCLYKISFGCLVQCWRKQRAHQQHTQQRDPTTPCCTTETTPAAPEGTTEKQGLSPVMFPFFLFFLHTSTTVTCKVLSLSSSAGQVLWWIYNIHKIAEKYSVRFARKSLLSLEWTNVPEPSWAKQQHWDENTGERQRQGKLLEAFWDLVICLASKPLCPEVYCKIRNILPN